MRPGAELFCINADPFACRDEEHNLSAYQRLLSARVRDHVYAFHSALWGYRREKRRFKSSAAGRTHTLSHNFLLCRAFATRERLETRHWQMHHPSSSRFNFPYVLVLSPPDLLHRRQVCLTPPAQTVEYTGLGIKVCRCRQDFMAGNMTFHVARMQQWTISCAGQGFVALLSRHACALTWPYLYLFGGTHVRVCGTRCQLLNGLRWRVGQRVLWPRVTFSCMHFSPLPRPLPPCLHFSVCA